MSDPESNPIGYLQEFCQGCTNKPFPQYVEVSSTGADHCKTFTYKCIFDGHEALGTCRQKKNAKSESAKHMIALLKEENYFDKFLGDSLDAGKDNKLANLGSDTSYSSGKNPISALNEYCQMRKIQNPVYTETAAGGSFVCECKVSDMKSYGTGSNKKSAKTEAAFKMCQQLKIKCDSLEFRLNESQNENDFHSEKNPISALQEFCQCDSSLPMPEYTLKPSILNSFVMSCSVGDISAEGRDLTKQGAKEIAASKVYRQLCEHHSKTSLFNKQVFCPTSSFIIKSEPKSAVTEKLKYELEEFKLYSEEGGEESNSKLSSEIEINIEKDFESLKITDSCTESENGSSHVKEHNISSNSQGNVQPPRSLHKTPISETVLKWAQQIRSQ